LSSSHRQHQNRVQAEPNNWFQRIGSWFSFVSGRRLDTRFAVLTPLPGVILIASMIACLAIVHLYDQTYLAIVKSGQTDGNTFFEIITMIGKSDWILYSTGLVILLLSIFSADRFRGKLHGVWHRVFLTFYFAFTSVAFSGLITVLFKFLFGRLRPPFVEELTAWKSVPFTPGYEFASFPSGHSTTSGALAMVLALLFPRFAIIFLPLGVLTAASRSFIGVHFPSDVLAGLTIGMIFTYVYARSFARKRLLFHFDDSGKLALRGEGRGHLHQWKRLFLGRGNK